MDMDEKDEWRFLRRHNYRHFAFAEFPDCFLLQLTSLPHFYRNASSRKIVLVFDVSWISATRYQAWSWIWSVLSRRLAKNTCSCKERIALWACPFNLNYGMLSLLSTVYPSLFSCIHIGPALSHENMDSVLDGLHQAYMSLFLSSIVYSIYNDSVNVSWRSIISVHPRSSQSWPCDWFCCLPRRFLFGIFKAINAFVPIFQPSYCWQVHSGTKNFFCRCLVLNDQLDSVTLNSISVSSYWVSLDWNMVWGEFESRWNQTIQVCPQSNAFQSCITGHLSQNNVSPYCPVAN